MRFTLPLALALAVVAAPAASEPQTPTSTYDSFAIPMGDAGYPGFYVPDRPNTTDLMRRLSAVCNSSALRDRRKCNRAWREINSAYAQLKAAQPAS